MNYPMSGHKTPSLSHDNKEGVFSGNFNFHKTEHIFIDLPDLLTNDFLIKPVEQILIATNNKPFWIDLVHEPYAENTEQYIKQALLSYDITDFYILTGNINYFYNPQSFIVYQPQSYLESRFNPVSVPKLAEDIIKNSNRKYILSCLNGRCRTHRVENFLLLKQKSYFENIKFSMYNHPEFEQKESTEPPFLSSLSKELLDEWNIVRNTLPQGPPNDWSANDEAYTNSYINFVTETSVDNTYWFLSEKIWKPIMAGQFFIVLAYPKTIQHLRELGIDVFDDVINHDYDNESNWHTRISMLHDEIDRLMSLNWQELSTKLRQRLYDNYEYFYSIELFNKCTRYLQPNSLLVDIQKN